MRWCASAPRRPRRCWERASAGRSTAGRCSTSSAAPGEVIIAASPLVTLLGANIAMLTAGCLTMAAAVVGLVRAAHHRISGQQSLEPRPAPGPYMATTQLPDDD